MTLLRVLLVAACPRPVRRARAGRPVRGTCLGGFEDVRHAVEALALSGDPQAAPTIRALQAGKLFVGARQVALHQARRCDRRTRAPATPATPPGAAQAGARQQRRAPRRRRGAGRACTLFSHDPSARANAAEAVFQSRDPAALPALDARARQGTGRRRAPRAWSRRAPRSCSPRPARRRPTSSPRSPP